MRHYSMEYVDEEGEVVIKHVSMTQSEALGLIQELARKGVSAKMYDLTPPQVDEAFAVSSLDEHRSEPARLAPSPTGCVE